MYVCMYFCTGVTYRYLEPSGSPWAGMDLSRSGVASPSYYLRYCCSHQVLCMPPFLQCPTAVLASFMQGDKQSERIKRWIITAMSYWADEQDAMLH